MVQRWVENTDSGPRYIGGKLVQPGEGVFVTEGPTAPDYRTKLTAVGATSDGGLVGPGESKRITSVLLRNEALYKPYSEFPSFGKSSGLSALDWTACVKAEIEGAFNAMRLVSQNRGNQALTGLSALVGVTETNDLSSSSNLSATVIGGVAYTGIAGASSDLGKRNVTWAGSATYGHNASTTAPDIVLSDWVPIKNVPRADGGTRPLAFWTYWKKGSTNGNWPFRSLNAAMRTPSPANRGRTIVASNCGVDGVSAPNQTFAVTNTAGDVFPIFRFDLPVVSIWAVGDSITGCSGLVADTISSWGWRACADLSTPARPVIFANFGVSSVASADFWANAKAYLAAGCPPPTMLILNANSINEIGATPNVRQLETIRSTAMDGLSVCRQYNIPFLALIPMLCNENIATAPLDALRRQINAEIQAIAAAWGVQWVDEFLSVGNGASPERYLPAYRFDAIHPNEAAVESVFVPAVISLMRKALG